MEQLIADIQNQSIWDWIVLITGILYVLYAARNNPICWIWGIISCGVLAYMTAAKYNLYADSVLNTFYVVMGFFGLYNWQYGESGNVLPVKRIPLTKVIIYCIIGVILAIAMAFTLQNYTSAAATGLDSFTTVFSIIATIWLIQRYIENWLLWIIVDVLYIYLYWTRGAVLYLVLFIIYTAIAIQGYYNWKKLMKDN